MKGNIQLYNTLMTNNYKCFPNTPNQGQASPRLTQLNIFYTLKNNHPFISRHLLYLAIAVLDKYLLKYSLEAQQQPITHKTMLVRAAASLLIAWKFIQTHHIPLAKLSNIVGSELSLRLQIIEMQAQMLQGIDFEVPIDFTYAAMTRAFQQANKPNSNQKTIASQCLAFLRQGLLFSNDFSLCSELGAQIVDLIIYRASKDVRIKEICQWFSNKNMRQAGNQTKVAQHILSK